MRNTGANNRINSEINHLDLLNAIKNLKKIILKNYDNKKHIIY